NPPLPNKVLFSLYFYFVLALTFLITMYLYAYFFYLYVHLHLLYELLLLLVGLSMLFYRVLFVMFHFLSACSFSLSLRTASLDCCAFNDFLTRVLYNCPFSSR